MKPRYEKGQVVYRAEVVDVPVRRDEDIVTVDKLEIREFVVTTRGEVMGGVRCRYMRKGQLVLSGIEDKGQFDYIERRYHPTKRAALDAFIRGLEGDIKEHEHAILRCRKELEMAKSLTLEEP